MKQFIHNAIHDIVYHTLQLYVQQVYNICFQQTFLKPINSPVFFLMDPTFQIFFSLTEQVPHSI